MLAGTMTVNRAHAIVRERAGSAPRRARPGTRNLLKVYMGLRVLIDANVTAEQILTGDGDPSVDDWLTVLCDGRCCMEALEGRLRARISTPTTEPVFIPSTSAVTGAEVDVDVDVDGFGTRPSTPPRLEEGSSRALSVAPASTMARAIPTGATDTALTTYPSPSTGGLVPPR